MEGPFIVRILHVDKSVGAKSLFYTDTLGCAVLIQQLNKALNSSVNEVGTLRKLNLNCQNYHLIVICGQIFAKNV
jgi:hypothetical protein